MVVTSAIVLKENFNTAGSKIVSSNDSQFILLISFLQLNRHSLTTFFL